MSVRRQWSAQSDSKLKTLLKLIHTTVLFQLRQLHNRILDEELVEKWFRQNWQNNSQGKIDDLRQHIGKAIDKIQRIQKVHSINVNLFKINIEQQIREALSPNSYHEMCEAYDKLLNLLQVALQCLIFCAQEVNKASTRSTAVQRNLVICSLKNKILQ